MPDIEKSAERAAAPALTPNSIPNLFHTIDYKMSFNEVVDWLGKCEKVTNLLMFVEGLWTWIITNDYKHESPAEVLPTLIEIKEKRGWSHVYSSCLNMWKYENDNLIDIIQRNRRLCPIYIFKKKWELFSNLRL